MRPDSFTLRSRFTLIELLTVVAILAILMAMLFPSLHLAKRKARTLGCVTNMHFQALCYTSYIEDYDQQFPRAWFDNSNNNFYIGGQAANAPFDPQGGDHNGMLLNSYAGVNEPVNMSNLLSARYSGQLYCSHTPTHADRIDSRKGAGGDGRQIFNCPGDIGTYKGTGLWEPAAAITWLTDNDAWDTTQWDKFGSRSYMYNALCNSNTSGQGYGLQYIQLQQVTHPSYTVMSTCFSVYGAYGNAMGNNNSPLTQPYNYTYWHSDAMSEGPALFVDLSVRSIKLYRNWGGNTAFVVNRAYGKTNNDPSKHADFNFCFDEINLATGTYLDMNDGR